MLRLPIYFDNNATTPVDPRVLDAMLPYFTEHYGNAASITHPFGQRARVAVEKARAEIAAALGAENPAEIVFTSGATESDNMAIKGIAEARRDSGDHIVTSALEHKAVLDSCHALEERGFSVTYLQPDGNGLVSPKAVREALTRKTVLASIMHANNEIGTIQDIAAIAAVCRERGVPFHTDAAQSIGKTPFDLREIPADLVSFTAHKLYGPKGIGGLFVRRGLSARPALQVHGGGHECGLRSGTLNVPGIVGFARAVALAVAEREVDAEHACRLRRVLAAAIQQAFPGAVLNGDAERRMPGNLNYSFTPEDAASLAPIWQEVAVSAGSACSAASSAPSHVLTSIGRPPQLASSAVRFGIGRFNTDAEAQYVAERIRAASTGVNG